MDPTGRVKKNALGLYVAFVGFLQSWAFVPGQFNDWNRGLSW